MTTMSIAQVRVIKIAEIADELANKPTGYSPNDTIGDFSFARRLDIFNRIGITREQVILLLDEDIKGDISPMKEVMTSSEQLFPATFAYSSFVLQQHWPVQSVLQNLHPAKSKDPCISASSSEDWGLQAFTLDEADEVYVNKVGTFGIPQPAQNFCRTVASVNCLTSTACGRCFHSSSFG